MGEGVNRDRRRERSSATEKRLLEAASAAFLRDGYAATSMATVADQAGVSHRTVYVRFETKAALFERVVGVALAGDQAPGDVHERAWYRRALTAPTADQRIAAHTRGSAALVLRAAPLIEVALQAAPTEPDIHAAVVAGRAATRASLVRFWTTMSEDELLPAPTDLAWLADTTALLAHVETYLHARAMLGMTQRRYPDWLATTFRQLALGGPAPAGP